VLVPPLFRVIMTKSRGDDPGYSIQESQEGGFCSCPGLRGGEGTFPGPILRRILSRAAQPEPRRLRKCRISSNKVFDFLVIGFTATVDWSLLSEAENLPQEENGISAAVLTQDASLSENE
jgi:hypothetical protein